MTFNDAAGYAVLGDQHHDHDLPPEPPWDPPQVTRHLRVLPQFPEGSAFHSPEPRLSTFERRALRLIYELYADANRDCDYPLAWGQFLALLKALDRREPHERSAILHYLAANT